MATRPLFEITADLLHVSALAEETDGDLSKFGEAEAALTAWLDSLAAEQSVKLDGYVALIKHLEMEQAAARAEAEQWEAKAGSRSRRIDWLKSRLKAHLELTGQSKVTTASGQTITVQANGGKIPVKYEQDQRPDDYPEYARIVTYFDTEKVFDALKAGTELPFAKLGERGTHLRVRT